MSTIDKSKTEKHGETQHIGGSAGMTSGTSQLPCIQRHTPVLHHLYNVSFPQSLFYRLAYPPVGTESQMPVPFTTLFPSEL
jgi:hypothetical protein